MGALGVHIKKCSCILFVALWRSLLINLLFQALGNVEETIYY